MFVAADAMQLLDFFIQSHLPDDVASALIVVLGRSRIRNQDKNEDNEVLEIHRMNNSAAQSATQLKLISRTKSNDERNTRGPRIRSISRHEIPAIYLLVQLSSVLIDRKHA